MPPLRINAFVLDPPVIERILEHINEPTTPPLLRPARGPPQAAFEFDQAAGLDEIYLVGSIEREHIVDGVKNMSRVWETCGWTS